MWRGLVPRLLLCPSVDLWREGAARRAFRETFSKRCGAAWCRACSWTPLQTCGARVPRVVRFARLSSSDAADLVPRLLLDSYVDVWREGAARRTLRETFFKRCGAAW